MNATRTITWKTSKGQSIEIKIERTIDVQDDISFSDGWNINLGKKTVDITEVTMYVDGKFFARSSAPQPISPITNSNYAKLTAAGAYASVCDAYIAKERYDQIMTAIAEMEAELTTPEYTEVKGQEIAREQAGEEALKAEYAAYQQELKNGLCPKCHTYCYGDCEANR